MLHGDQGVASVWAEAACPGDVIGMIGPRRWPHAGDGLVSAGRRRDGHPGDCPHARGPA
ncbi:siderophore-interacting protein [Rhizobium rhizogenes]|uniref:siderophore-interacting protein n=1 Tax=Rhizobium rhizogenes TaxID=359 RepID=UPI002868FF53|nr:siderophore-interacting protein [Rhizobium rhizogenes]